MSMSISINFKDGQKWTKDQKHTLGQIGYDERGARWSYVQLAHAVETGRVVKDTHRGDLLSAETGTLTTAQAIGSDKLVDSGEFGATDDKLLVGALGQISGHADGQAQAFYIKEWIDANTLRIELLMDRSGAAHGGWSVALTTDSVYTLWFPGYVRVAGEADGDRAQILRGVTQSRGGAKEYGWVRQTRGGWASIDASGDNITQGYPVAVTANGRVEGYDDTVTSNAVDQVPTDLVGRAPFGDISGSTDRLAWITFDIVNEELSYRDPDMFHAFNLVDITGSI